MRSPAAIPAANRGRPANGAIRTRRWALAAALTVALALGLRAGLSAILESEAGAGAGEPALFAGASPRPEASRDRAALLAAIEPMSPATEGARAPAAADGAPSELAPSEGEYTLRFLREAGDLPAAALRVRLTPLAGAPGSAFEARTDRDGLLRVPHSVGLRAFALRLGGDDGPELTAEPARLERPAWISASIVEDVRVRGAVARVSAVARWEGGEPALGAAVEFELLPLPGSAASALISCSLRDAPTTRVTVDADGMATWDLFDPASQTMALRAHIVQASNSPWISSQVELAPPLDDVRIDLALHRAASLVVRVQDHAGLALSERMVRVRGLESSRLQLGIASDPNGRSEFQGLAPGSYAVEFDDATSGTRAQATFRLIAGEHRDLVLTLPAPELPLAVAGRVRTAEGVGLRGARVSIRVDGREEAQLVVDAAGDFAYHRAPCERLRVGMVIDSRRAEVSPGVLEVPFGARDVEFTIAPAGPAIRGSLRVIDARDRSPVDGARVRTLREADVERVDGYVASIVAPAETNTESLAPGVYAIVMPSASDARVWVDSPSHRRVELDRAALAGLPTLDGLPTLALEPGHARRWLLLDAVSGASIAGASVVIGYDAFLEHREAQEGRAIAGAISDARGRIEVVLPAPPRRWAILAPGYRSHALEVEARWIEVLRLER